MKEFSVTILGSGAALPARGRHPSAQVLNANGSFYLIDCGEGTQDRMREIGIPIQKINTIFISHLHGDHYLGLVGLISSMHLLGREKELTVYGPNGIKEIIEIQLNYSGSYLRYPLKIIQLALGSGTIHSDKNLFVDRFPLKHRIDCHGFRFTECEEERNILKDSIARLELSIENIKELKRGIDVHTENGLAVRSADVTISPRPSRNYAYCSDTAFLADLTKVLQNCDLLYHEATFADDMSDRAKDTQHSTAKQAALIAKGGNVKKLMIGHFSSRYKDPELLLAEAKEVFPNTFLAEEGVRFPIG